MSPKRINTRVGRSTLASLAIIGGLAGLGVAGRNAVTTTQEGIGDRACQVELRAYADEPVDSIRARRARLCAFVIDTARRHDAEGRLHADMLRLAEVHAMIPEYHDEQRLPGDGTSDLGPQAGIYASPNLGDFKDEWQFEAHGAKGVLVAYVVVERRNLETLPMTYQNLGLDWGLNCVWVVKTAGSPTWSARARPARGGRICDRRGPDGTILNVDRKTLGGTQDENYPPVARFSESTSGHPLLGVRCGKAWCDIGAGAFTALDPLGLTSPGTVRARVKGWHDEQLLSVPRWVSPTSYVFERTNIRAALIPRDGIENFPESQFQGNWTEVGTLKLLTAPPVNSKYSRWGLTAGENDIDLRWDPDANGEPVWRAQLRPGDGGPPRRWSFNQREVHYDAGIPGTLRFRWTIMDDGIWAPCGHACCQVEGY